MSMYFTKTDYYDTLPCFKNKLAGDNYFETEGVLM
jgi:hypothetical protein